MLVSQCPLSVEISYRGLQVAKDKVFYMRDQPIMYKDDVQFCKSAIAEVGRGLEGPCVEGM